MRRLLSSTVMAIGIGLLASTGGSAAPMNGAAPLNAAVDLGVVEQVQRGGRGGGRGGGARGGVARGGGVAVRGGGVAVRGGGVAVRGGGVAVRRGGAVAVRGAYRGARVHGGRVWRGGRWVYTGGCSYSLWVVGFATELHRVYSRLSALLNRGSL